ncbi:MAG TPA: LacI family DNA-binding transcriptional regulator [Candidatus Dormibacteraeota bacterium]|nr:LacI family DNA-binding transcriptional regulator [Candidatus Dormibacteraeota bacterium]
MPGDQGERPTIADVARLASVSIGTASKAVNGKGRLRPETRDRVLAAARELDYQPDALARSLRTQRTYTVGLITSDSFGRFSIPVMLGLEDTLGADRISVYLCDARGDPVRERYYVDSLLSRRVDGIVVAGRRADPRPPISRHELPVPVVYAMTQSMAAADISLVPDDEHGGRLAGEHLLALGRRRIAHVTGPVRFAAVRRRAAGLRGALAAAGIELREEEVLSGPWSEAWGRDAVAPLLSRAPELDAIFCGSDQIARGVADALRERGMRIPGDVALVGFDNWDVMALGARPPLTSVDMNLDGLGRAAGEELLSMLDGERRSGVLRLPCELVVRASTVAEGTEAETPPSPPEGEGRGGGETRRE